MDQALLVEPFLEDTQKLLHTFDADGKPVHFAAWCRDEESGQWKLWLASAYFDDKIRQDHSIKPSLLEIIDTLKKAQVRELDLLNTKLVLTMHPVPKTLAKHYKVDETNSPLKTLGGRFDEYSFDIVIIMRLTLDTTKNG